MKLALLGRGKMGTMVEKAAAVRNHEIVGIQSADVCIDFSHPDVVLANIKMAAELKKNIVVGTTGWYEHLPDIKTLIEVKGTGFLYSPNFSIGIHLFMKIVSRAAELLNSHQEYDVGGCESHHNQKADAPSGTAKALTEILKNYYDKAQNLQFSSIRCGHIPGTHTVLFDSPADSITLTHTARNREGFAQGAVCAAEWLHGKKGFYTLDDMLVRCKV